MSKIDQIYVEVKAYNAHSFKIKINILSLKLRSFTIESRSKKYNFTVYLYDCVILDNF